MADLTFLKREAYDEEGSFIYSEKQDREIYYGAGNLARTCIEVVILMNNSTIEFRGKFNKFISLADETEGQEYCQIYSPTHFFRSINEKVSPWEVFSNSAVNTEEYKKCLAVTGYEEFDKSSKLYGMLEEYITPLLDGIGANE